MKTFLALVLTVATFALSARADGTKTDFQDSCFSIDNTTNVVRAIAVPNNSTLRIEVRLVAVADDGTSASYLKMGTFNNLDGVIRQVGSSATVGSAEDVNECDAILAVKGNVVVIQIAGATGKVMEWEMFGTTYTKRHE